MREIVPIFGHNSFDSELLPFNFGAEGVRLNTHDKSMVPISKNISEYSSSQIKSAHYSFEFEGINKDIAMHDITLILLSCRITQSMTSPYIKYRYTAGLENSGVILTETPTTNETHLKKQKYYSDECLNQVKDMFLGLKSMEFVSERTANALYFVSRELYSQHWIDSFIFLSSAIESLLSKDKAGGATKAIVRRLAYFLSEYNVEEQEISNLYSVRSEFVHGRYRYEPDKQQDNLELLGRMEQLTYWLLKKYVSEALYNHYETKVRRDKFLGNISLTAA